jgi:ABC-type transporter Mla MlaB component
MMAARAGTTPVFTIRGPLVTSDVLGLCVRLRSLLTQSDAAVALCDVDGYVEADLVAIDALARLQLGARRNGRSLRLNSASPDVHQLLAFVGLDESLGIETRRQPEQREELLGVEEERDLADPFF